ncbi:HK97 family phage prohead protease [Methylocystis echinoides]|uniref:Peptidase n=1 Tax=Methylocystis echinoides TaxID=29468 RepID=A0A9W6GVY5_9HYPH|nr:HK97 family phage prohead protease [Methylocystis echinoides]GLI93946.1 peptidase [Methylocystis echinoides]
MMERRAFQLEVRAGSNPRQLEGFAATFDSEARVGDFIEVIRPGAFAATLASGADILALVDHDPTRVLGRTKSGTLRLTENQRGLAFTIDIPDTSLGHDMLALAQRSDLGGMSFGFRAVDEYWNGNRRELRAVELREISVVSAWPAYTNTSVEARFANIGGRLGVGMRRSAQRWRA